MLTTTIEGDFDFEIGKQYTNGKTTRKITAIGSRKRRSAHYEITPDTGITYKDNTAGLKSCKAKSFMAWVNNSRRPPEVWANRVSLGGLWSPKPIHCVQRDFDNEWGDGKDFSIEKLGLTVGYGSVTFVSTDKTEVEQWTTGAQAVMTMLHKWSS